MATKNPYQGDDYDFFEAARDEEGGIRKEKPSGNVSTPKKETFREAFASARKEGKDSFTWNGKKYSTEMAKPAAKSSAKSEAPSASTTARAAASNMGRVGPTKERAAGMPTAPRPTAETSRGVRAEAPAKTEMQRNTAANAKANRERMEEQRKAREERKAKSSDSKPMFGRNPAGKTPAEVRKEKGFAKGGSVSARADGIAKRGKTKCKII